LAVNSGEMLFMSVYSSVQAVLQLIFLCFLLFLVDIFQMAAIPYTGNVLDHCMVC